MCIALLLAAAALLETGLGPVPGFEKGWTFVRDGREPAVVDIPHDGAIDFGFDWNRWDSGCGALPYAGHGEYVKRVTLERGGKSWRLEVDGAMSCSKIFVNGRKAAERPFGYAAFVVPLDGLLVDGGNEFRITVDPPADSSRWYPGFGLYREIRLVSARPDHVVPGSVAFAFSNVTAASAEVTVSYEMSKGGARRRTFTVREPKLWSPESPHLYTVELEGEMFRYGIRTLRFDSTEGFFLNGHHRQMRGVCLHHDLGLFGAAFVREEASRRLDLLKEMGCDAIRTSHNPPSQGFLDLCDEKGFLVMAESFDEWRRPKVTHGMSEMWDVWHRTEIETVVRNARRHPSVVMWSIGNELIEDLKSEYEAEGAAIAKELVATVRRLDPEDRPVTAGHYVDATATNAVGAATDVFGGNYLPHRYAGFRGKQGVIGTETCSTASSRGVYDLQTTNLLSVSRQVLSYDLYPVHGNDYPPDVEFAAQEANPHCYGEFVWTGFDYIGEPDPWRGKARSSYFGIFDLAGFPKDRYWLYKAQWRPDEPTAHILPHWNWKRGDVVPVHVYSSGDEAELFVNGVSQGRRHRGTGWTSHRFVWETVPYAPGEVSVRTWKDGRPWAEDRIQTSGPFDHFVFHDERRGKYLFRSAEAVDAKGVFVPTAAEPVSPEAPADYRFLGACNGDPTDTVSLRSPLVRSFSGRALLVFEMLEPPLSDDRKVFRRVIEISEKNPRYFETADGRPWIPIGCNICFDRNVDDGPGAQDAVRKNFDRWLRAFAANGGNCIRLWAGHKSLEVMPDRPGVYDPERTKTLRGIVSLCEALGVKVKITLESFRSTLDDPSKARQPVFNRKLYAPYADNVPAFFRSQKCWQIYFGKAQYLKDLGFGDSTAVYCWELWNEINATGPMSAYGPWSDRALGELKKMFPRQLAVNNLGSFSDVSAYQHYDALAAEKDNDFMQVHRYLDAGADLDVCRGPMDVVAASAVREMLDRRPDRPAILAEVGAVKPNHTGPFEYYQQDKEGTLLHDAVFAPFFAGSAGCGQYWHWDHQYIDGNRLWWHYRRFATAIEGLDPIAEGFRPFYTESRRLRLYGLRGKKTAVVWCRDKESSWASELAKGKKPEVLNNESVPFRNCKLECYLPWEDRHVTVDAPQLPPFRRSIVVRVPADAVEGVVRPH